LSQGELEPRRVAASNRALAEALRAEVWTRPRCCGPLEPVRQEADRKRTDLTDPTAIYALTQIRRRSPHRLSTATSS